MDILRVYALVCLDEALTNERLPMLLSNGAERVVPAGSIQRTVAIENHFLNNMLTAA